MYICNEIENKSTTTMTNCCHTYEGYEACKSTSPHFKFVKLIIKLIKREANQQLFGNNGNDKTNISADILLVFVTIYIYSFCQLIMQMAKLKCGKILSYAIGQILPYAIGHIISAYMVVM